MKWLKRVDVRSVPLASLRATVKWLLEILLTLRHSQQEALAVGGNVPVSEGGVVDQESQTFPPATS
jgi:hypothetical protein